MSIFWNFYLYPHSTNKLLITMGKHYPIYLSLSYPLDEIGKTRTRFRNTQTCNTMSATRGYTAISACHGNANIFYALRYIRWTTSHLIVALNYGRISSFLHCVLSSKQNTHLNVTVILLIKICNGRIAFSFISSGMFAKKQNTHLPYLHATVIRSILLLLIGGSFWNSREAT